MTLSSDQKAVEEHKTTLKKAQQLKMTGYNLRTELGQHCYTENSRPYSTLEEVLNITTRHRMKLYVPTDFDLPDYESGLFSK